MKYLTFFSHSFLSQLALAGASFGIEGIYQIRNALLVVKAQGYMAASPSTASGNREESLRGPESAVEVSSSRQVIGPSWDRASRSCTYS